MLLHHLQKNSIISIPMRHQPNALVLTYLLGGATILSVSNSAWIHQFKSE